MNSLQKYLYKNVLYNYENSYITNNQRLQRLRWNKEMTYNNVILNEKKM